MYFFNFSDVLTIKALEHRQGEKLAKEFLKKFKQRIGSNNPKANNQWTKTVSDVYIENIDFKL